MGKDKEGWFLEELRFANKLLEAPNCTYQCVVMQQMLNQKNKKKNAGKGVGYTHSNTTTYKHMLCYLLPFQSFIPHDQKPQSGWTENRQTTSHQSHMARPFHRVNHITRRKFKGIPTAAHTATPVCFRARHVAHMPLSLSIGANAAY